MATDEGPYARVEWPERQAACDAALGQLRRGDAGRAAKAYEALVAPFARDGGPKLDAANRSLLSEQAALAFQEAGHWADAREWYERAADTAREAGRIDRLASAIHRRAELEGQEEDLDALAVLGQEALGLLREARPPGVEAALRRVVGLNHLARQRFTEALREARRAFLLSRGGDARERLAHLFDVIGACAYGGDFNRALRLVGLARKAARALDPPAEGMAARAAFSIGIVGNRSGAREDNLGLLVEACREAGRLGQTFLHFKCLGALAEIAWSAGWPGALLRLAEQLRRAEESIEAGPRFWPSSCQKLCQAALALGLSGRLRTAGRELEERVRDLSDYPRALLASRDLRAYVEIERGPEAARETARFAIDRLLQLRRDPVARAWLHPVILDHRLYLAAGELREGRLTAARAALANLAELGVDPEGPIPLRAETRRVEAALLRAEGKPAEAVKAARAGWKLAADHNNPPDILRAGAAFVTALTAAGRTGEARPTAELLRWIAGWMASKVDPGHRAGLRTWAPVGDALAAVASAGVDPEAPPAPDGSLGPPPAPLPWLADLDRDWKTLVESGLLGEEKQESVFEREERVILERALADAGGNMSRAARLLKISKTTMFYKLRRLGISPAGR